MQPVCNQFLCPKPEPAPDSRWAQFRHKVVIVWQLCLTEANTWIVEKSNRRQRLKESLSRGCDVVTLHRTFHQISISLFDLSSVSFTMSTSCPLHVHFLSSSCLSQPKCTHSPTPRCIRNNSRFGGPRPTPQALASPLTPNRVHASVSILALFTFALASNTRMAAGVPHFTRQISQLLLLPGSGIRGRTSTHPRPRIARPRTDNFVPTQAKCGPVPSTLPCCSALAPRPAGSSRCKQNAPNCSHRCPSQRQPTPANF